MTDVHSQSIRSKNMRAIRHKDTAPELLVRRGLHSLGFRYRLHVKELAGRPDIVLPKHKAVIFVHGCFWHQHNCPLFKMPETRTQFWLDKITGNGRRDEVVLSSLVATGWRVAVVWECALKGRYRLPASKVSSMLADWLQLRDMPNNMIDVQGTW